MCYGYEEIFSTMIKFFKWTKILNKNFCLFKINLKIIVLYLFAVELFDWILKVDIDRVKIEII